MATLDALKALYEEYEITATQVLQKASAFAGIFGIGADPRDHSCHDSFFDAVGIWVADFLENSPSGESAAEVVRFMLEAPWNNREKPTYWYLYAAHGHTRELIPLLSEDVCRSLRDFYDFAYPREDRPPVQREIYKLLQQYAGQKISGGSFFQRLLGKK